ncbi:MAG: DNA polymerase III subunit delta [Deltaproteobacteria bacterium CG11_big_fil_rev_8_21_14_0_20_47_16]|nr:MAG: DNA polymerase III subunit delta [Deltaproteobacteria bacterium CG11_big_fil_rev_8_21_14_0_20_47_16]
MAEHSIHLVLGDDIYLQTEAMDRIVAQVKKQHGDGLHVERHDAEQFDIPACLEAAQSVSMWGTHTLIIVRNINDWDWGKADALLDYTRSPNPATSILLQANKVDGRIKAIQNFKAACDVIQCKPLYANQIPDWLRQLTKSMDKNLSLEAANWCIELVGTDLSMLKRAIEGLSLYVGTKPTIDLADVEGFLSNTSQHDIFELCKALGMGRLADATQYLDNLLGNGEPPVRINYMIARHWRILLGLRAATTKPEADAVIRQFKLPPFFVGEYQSQAKRWEPRRLMRGLATLARTDRKLKSSKMDNALIEELAMLSL